MTYSYAAENADELTLQPGQVSHNGEVLFDPQSQLGVKKSLSIKNVENFAFLHILMIKQAMISKLGIFFKCIKGYNIFEH